VRKVKRMLLRPYGIGMVAALTLAGLAGVGCSSSSEGPLAMDLPGVEALSDGSPELPFGPDPAVDSIGEMPPADLVGVELPGEVVDVAPEFLPDLFSELSPDGGDLPLDFAGESATDLGPHCGNGECDVVAGEDCEVCPQDCGSCTVCGNGVCEPGQPVENPESCPEDCGLCGDGVCGMAELEEEHFCAKDCGVACGDGTCSGAESALEDEEGYCPVDCGGCFDGVCGFQDLFNPELAWCKDTDCGAACGNGECSGGESWADCPVDCGWCGDGVCGKVGKDVESCAQGNRSPPSISSMIARCLAGCKDFFGRSSISS